jgi:predicted double-glycine peptidase
MKNNIDLQVRLKVPYWKQDRDHYTCGPICVRMVSSYFEGRLLNKREYAKILEVTMNGNPKRCRGTSGQEMGKALHMRCLNYRTIYGIKALEKAIVRNHPVIVRCLMHDGNLTFKHYIVIIGKDEHYLYINDSYAGKPGKIQKKIFLKRAQKMNWGNKKWGIEIFKD